MSIETQQAENELLWSEILDNPEWFVSPRGDKYSQAADPDFNQRGLTALTFNVNRLFPREHLVTMSFTDVEEPFSCWLDTRRRILDTNHRPLYADIRMREGFLNMVLKRLFSITAKLYGSYGSHARGEGGDWGYQYKRAHYTFLTSDPPRRIYTMQSLGARMHAAEILEDYGIDIYTEIERRRRLGRLEEDQFLTFTRESNPDIPGWVPVPNELRYDPDKVQHSIENLLVGRHPTRAEEIGSNVIQS